MELPPRRQSSGFGSVSAGTTLSSLVCTKMTFRSTPIFSKAAQKVIHFYNWSEITIATHIPLGMPLLMASGYAMVMVLTRGPSMMAAMTMTVMIVVTTNLMIVIF